MLIADRYKLNHYPSRKLANDFINEAKAYAKEYPDGGIISIERLNLIAPYIRALRGTHDGLRAYLVAWACGVKSLDALGDIIGIRKGDR